MQLTEAITEIRPGRMINGILFEITVTKILEKEGQTEPLKKKI